MLLTKKSEYALLALVLISNSPKPKNAETIANELNISKSFLSKILQIFTKKEILKSYKGVNGGFVLAIPACQLTILDITTIAEDKIPTVFECSPSMNFCPSAKASGCSIWPLLNNLQNKIDDFLKELTLKDIM
ncbi:MAG: Rrf2 family transcriptional regulator [Campylobacteraceae bacterium]|jgi:Rrf2 family protein|nr:Rrf2 family transcriptional regulator [Campylobacteraceae bacterium]MBT3882699.1 Rrf2 family transcriptional regulator [Campylobacteraceae bacterium]MBT4030425.1 Rrf2 family transcriptional regulator [Campylobacteraceae bacterium]MBT4178990.1 Rrf2 family transcriptional regulator [Campylobacteraceae bacterium]MBT4573011.1 Rrf2 family transcriptional regulator [Campylobacteraceae bacterium]